MSRDARKRKARGATGVEVRFHNSITGNFMIYQDRLKTNLLQVFAHTENYVWLSTIPVIIFEVNIVAEQRQALLVTVFCFFISFYCPQLLLPPPYPTAAPASLGVREGANNVVCCCVSAITCVCQSSKNFVVTWVTGNQRSCFLDGNLCSTQEQAVLSTVTDGIKHMCQTGGPPRLFMWPAKLRF